MHLRHHIVDLKSKTLLRHFILSLSKSTKAFVVLSERNNLISISNRSALLHWLVKASINPLGAEIRAETSKQTVRVIKFSQWFDFVWSTSCIS